MTLYDGESMSQILAQARRRSRQPPFYFGEGKPGRVFRESVRGTHAPIKAIAQKSAAGRAWLERKRRAR